MVQLNVLQQVHRNLDKVLVDHMVSNLVNVRLEVIEFYPVTGVADDTDVLEMRLHVLHSHFLSILC